jgi:hypothetical protein
VRAKFKFSILNAKREETKAMGKRIFLFEIQMENPLQNHSEPTDLYRARTGASKS